MNSESIKKVTNQAIEQLVEALNAGHSEALTGYLAAMAKFRAYSFLNVLLILKQCPNAGRVAGYRTWQSFGRQVRQGENGIMILAPIFRKRTETADESNTTDEARKVAGFRAVYVWDEQQTTGKELPQIGSVTGDPTCYLTKLRRKPSLRWFMNWRIRTCTSESAGPIPISASARRKRHPWLTLFARPSGLKRARPRRITSACTEETRS